MDDVLAELVLDSIKYLEAEGLLYVGTTPAALLPVACAGGCVLFVA
jgi:hypothetical protein